MKEDLGMVGNQYNIVNTVFTVGYTVAQFPQSYAMLKFRPRYWLTFCSFAWGLLTLGMYKAKNFQDLCVIRFFQAVFEASTFSGTHYLLGHWYKPNELTKRAAVFTSSGLVGNIFSGFMQSAIYGNMDGKGGLAGWRWLFIIDCIITMPICLYCFFCFPDTPATCQSHMFSEEERKLAIERLPPAPKPKLDMTVFRRVLGKWEFYLFSLLWAISGENESWCINSCFSLWLKAEGYSVSARTNYPNGIYAVGIFATLTAAMYVDYTGAVRHWQVACMITVMLLIATIMILAAPLKANVIFAAHYLTGFSYAGQAAYFAWANVVCHDDREMRAIILFAMQTFSNATNAWWSIVFYGSDTAPKFTKGGYAMIATSVSSLIVAMGIKFMYDRDLKRQRGVAVLEGVNDEERAVSTATSKEKSLVRLEDEDSK